MIKHVIKSLRMLMSGSCWDKLHKNIVMDGDMMIDMKAHEVLGPEVDYSCWKEEFKTIL